MASPRIAAGAFAATALALSACAPATAPNALPPPSSSAPLARESSAPAPPAPRASTAEATPPEPPPGSDARHLTAGFERALADARVARHSAAETLAPRYVGNGGEASVVAFVAGPMKRWALTKKGALERADAAYVAAIEAAANRDERLLALSEVAPLWSDFCDEMVRGTPVPDEWKSDPDKVRAYVDGIADAQAPIRNRSRVFADRCVAEAAQGGDRAIGGAAAAALKHCIALRDHLMRR